MDRSVFSGNGPRNGHTEHAASISREQRGATSARRPRGAGGAHLAGAPPPAQAARPAPAEFHFPVPGKRKPRRAGLGRRRAGLGRRGRATEPLRLRAASSSRRAPCAKLGGAFSAFLRRPTQPRRLGAGGALEASVVLTRKLSFQERHPVAFGSHATWRMKDLRGLCQL